MTNPHGPAEQPALDLAVPAATLGVTSDERIAREEIDRF
jgi:hypothetical protein